MNLKAISNILSLSTDCCVYGLFAWMSLTVPPPKDGPMLAFYAVTLIVMVAYLLVDAVRFGIWAAQRAGR